jgi:hypothetical protein
MCPRRMVPVLFFISSGISSVSLGCTRLIILKFPTKSWFALTPFHSLSGTHGPCHGCLWRDDMRAEDDEFLWTINWCCNGRSGEENSGKKGVEEHDVCKIKSRVSKRVEKR